jgi:large subunit ribosomal protein L34
MKRTYQPNKARRAKKHGFLSRSKTNKGKRVIKRRMKKGRHKLTVSDEK